MIDRYIAYSFTTRNGAQNYNLTIIYTSDSFQLPITRGFRLLIIYTRIYI